MIAVRYPDTTFDVFEGDDPTGVYLRVKVDSEDTSDASPALDKLHELEFERGLPIYVVTEQPLELVLKLLKARESEPRCSRTLLNLPR